MDGRLTLYRPEMDPAPAHNGCREDRYLLERHLTFPCGYGRLGRMTKLIHMTGDIFTSTAPAIGHGVNVDGVMGHGIAVEFRNRFDHMHTLYREKCANGELLPGQVYIYQYSGHPERYVYNIASQDRPGRNARYDWLISGTVRALEHAQSRGLDRIALPRIGSGIGGLYLPTVQDILETLATFYEPDIELWTLPR